MANKYETDQEILKEALDKCEEILDINSENHDFDPVFIETMIDNITSYQRLTPNQISAIDNIYSWFAGR